MHTQNGRADTLGGRMDLGTFLPERQEVTLNGNVYQAWVVTNWRCPGTVRARLMQIRQRYARAVLALVQEPPTEPQRTDGPEYVVWRQQYDRWTADTTRAQEEADIAYARYTVDSLVILIPGLLETEADLFFGVEPAKAEKLLTDLGWFNQQEEGQKSSTADDAGPLTGGISSPDSVLSTESVSPNS